MRCQRSRSKTRLLNSTNILHYIGRKLLNIGLKNRLVIRISVHDEVVTCNSQSENNLQTGLQQILQRFGMKISIQKSKIMVLVT